MLENIKTAKIIACGPTTRGMANLLPLPKEFALKDETVKVTIALSKTRVEFFKKEAKNTRLNIKK